MTDMQMPVVTPIEWQFTQLCQVTVRDDEEIAGVNQLLSDGWRLIDIGQWPDATVYVLGRMEEVTQWLREAVVGNPPAETEKAPQGLRRVAESLPRAESKGHFSASDRRFSLAWPPG
jgi:hypothetical protein